MGGALPARPLRAALAAAALAASAAGAAHATGADEREDHGAGAFPAIVGGGKANPRGWGFVVTIEARPSRFFCTGSLIAPTKVLTAGHCVTRVKVADLRVRAGSPWSRGKRRAGQIEVRRARRAPGYNFRKDFRDLAVLTLRRPADAPAVELATAREAKRATRPLRRVRSAGFGSRTAHGYNLAARLKATREIAYPNPLCRRYYGKKGFDPASMLCALGKVIRRHGPRAFPFRTTTCTGDSGGPLVARTPDGPRLIAVTSVGPLPCGASAPSIYARVSAELRFIRRAAGLPKSLGRDSNP